MGLTPAFSYCYSLTGITIPNSVTSIGDSAFSYCYSLTGITIPNSVTSIGDFTFAYCTNLINVTIPDSVTSIGYRAFGNATSLTTITLPGSVTSIGESAFYHCSSLTNVTIPDSVTSIRDSAFFLCSSLTNITVPNSVTSIGFRAFAACNSLTSITIPDSVTSIGDSAFSSCSSLTDITIPGSVTSIGDSAFYRCSSLTNVTIPDSVTSIGDSAFRYCDSLTGITIPDSVTSFGDFTFEYCTNLTNITISDSVTSIGDDTFAYCTNLTNVTISDSVTSIGYRAFARCDSLTDVYYTGSEEEWNTIYIGNNNSDLTNATIHFNSTGPSDDGSDNDSETTILTEALTLTEGDSEMITFSATGTNLSEDQVRVTSQDESVAQVSLDKVWVMNLYDTEYFLGTFYISGISPGETQVILTYPGTEKTITVTVEEYIDPTDPADFNESTYRANQLLEPDRIANSRMEEVLGDIQSVEGTPSRLFLSRLSDSNFSAGVTAWESLGSLELAVSGPSGFVDKTVKTQDLYTAMILQCLKVSSGVNFTNTLKNANKAESTILQQFVNILKTEYNLDIVGDMIDRPGYESLTSAQKASINEELQKLFEKEFPVTIVTNTFKTFNQGMELFETLEDYIEYIYTGVQLMSLSDSMKTVLSEMLDQCPASNTMLRLALTDCVEIMNEGPEEFMARAAGRVFTNVGWKSAKYLMEEFWGSIYSYAQKSVPALSYLMVGYETGKIVSNTLFSTDNTITAYYNMRIMTEIESVAYNTYRSLASNYCNSNAIEDAQALLSCSDFIFQVFDSDCVEANDFVNVLDQSAVNKICEFFGCTNNYDSLKSAIETERDYNDARHFATNTDWVYSLEEDYPNSGLYEAYSFLISEESDKMVNKEYRVACPVDVLVYDQSTGELAAAVIDGTISNNHPENLTVIVNGEEKIFWMAEGTDYKMTLIGSDTGTMDITVNEFDEEENVIRTVSYDDVALTSGKTYEATVNSQSMEESNYTLTDLSDSGTVTKTQDTLDAGDTAYTLQVNLGIATVNGQQGSTLQVTPGQMVDLAAFVPDGYAFLGWTVEQGSVSLENSTESTTTFRMPAGNVTITANLQEKPEISYDLNGDGAVNVTDVMTLAQFVVNDNTNPACDLNQDTVVDVRDVMFLAQAVVNLK